MASKIVVLDFETTGFKPFSSEITEISAIAVNPKTFEIIEEYNTLIKIKANFIPAKVVELTGITWEMTQNQGVDIEVAKKEMARLLEDAVVVAHNVQFDFQFLAHYFGIEPKDYIDTLSLSRIIEPTAKSHKLGDICKRHGITLDGAHRAANDVLATIHVLKWQVNSLKKSGIKPSKYFNIIHKGGRGVQYRPKHTREVL